MTSPMTDDLVGRLRTDAAWQRKMRGGTTNHDMLDEAAARIEALEAENRVLRGGLGRIAQRDPGNIVRNDEDCERHTLWNIARYTIADADRLRVAQHLKQENANEMETD